LHPQPKDPNPEPHAAPGWEDDDPRMAKYYVKLAEVVLAHNSSKKKIPFEKLPLLPRPHKGEPFDCATAVFLQDAARCNITSCIFKRNNVGVSVDDRTHVLVENCTVLSGYYGFVDAVEWGVPKPLMEPSDTGATVELAGNKVRGRLWASANMPKVTRVLRRNVVEPTSMRPDFRM
jgi:parallel beta-helix repeat protein